MLQPQQKPSKFEQSILKLISNFIINKSTRDSIRTAFLNLGFKETIKKISKINNEKEKNDFKYYLSIILIIKDEAEYLNEWIEFYLLQGVDHFYIYDNESSDNIKEVLQPYIEKGLVTYDLFVGKSKNKQSQVYNGAIEKYKNETKWFAPLDTDEFAYAPNDKTIAEYLKDNEKYNQIVMKWWIYGNSGHETKPEGLVIENFTMREKVPNGSTKSIVQGKKVLYMLVHKHGVVGKTKYAPLNEIRCNHYYGKSVEEYKNKKMKRGWISSSASPEEMNMDVYNNLNKNEVSDPMPEEIVKKVKENINK